MSESIPIHEARAAVAAAAPQHASIARFGGRWRAEVRFWMDPAAPPHVSHGVMENALILGGRFLQ